MRHVYSFAAIGCLMLLAGRASAAPSVNFNFADGTSDGWSNSGFGSTPLSPVTNIGGANYIVVPLPGFQVANVATGDTSSALFQAMQAAALNPAGYMLSYNWYVDTSAFTGASFLQIGSFVNGGDGAYNQDFGTVKEVELNGTQLSSGGIFQGQVSVNMAAAGLILPPTETFYRLGLIENGSGTGVQVEFTNISISPVPEPASMSLVCLLPALAIRRRRRA